MSLDRLSKGKILVGDTLSSNDQSINLRGIKPLASVSLLITSALNLKIFYIKYKKNTITKI